MTVATQERAFLLDLIRRTAQEIPGLIPHYGIDRAEEVMLALVERGVLVPRQTVEDGRTWWWLEWTA